MKLTSRILQYTVKSNEDVGMWTEKIICDIVKIPFNSKRQYINTNDTPFKLQKDLTNSLSKFLI